MEEITASLETYFKDRYRGWDGSSQFEGTGRRVQRMYEELCWENERIEKECTKQLRAVFEDCYDHMLVIGPTEVKTLCPHHLIPCIFKVYIGYLPDGKVLGLSKFSRVAVLLGKRPVMQEMYSRELADLIESNLKPRGVGVYVEGTHGCIQSRGVTQDNIVVTTSTLRGNFLEASVKEEFLQIVWNSKKNGRT